MIRTMNTAPKIEPIRHNTTAATAPTTAETTRAMANARFGATISRKLVRIAPPSSGRIGIQLSSPHPRLAQMNPDPAYHSRSLTRSNIPAFRSSNTAPPRTIPTSDPAAEITSRRCGESDLSAENVVTPPRANSVIDTGSAPKRRAVKACPASWARTARNATTTHTTM